MKLKDFRVAWRMLVGDPGYSSVVILGLAAAITCAYLISAFLVDVLAPDASITEPQQVVRLEFKPNIPGRSDDWLGKAPFVFRDALRQGGAPVTAVTRVQFNRDTSIKVQDRPLKIDVAFVDPDAIDIFGLRARQGDLGAALSRPDAVALTDEAATRLFGGANPIGQQLIMGGRTLVVQATLKKPPANSSIHYEGLIGFESPSNPLEPWQKTAWYAMSGTVYARMLPSAHAEFLGAYLQDMFDRSPMTKEIPAEWHAGGRKAAFLRAVPVGDLALQGAGSAHTRLLVIGLAAVALCLLVLAAINYVNLSTVKTLRRQREIGIRKALGARPRQLTMQFVGESMMVAMIAVIVALALAALLAPTFSDLIDHPFDDRLFSVPRLLVLVALACMLGTVTGLYPARVALSIDCAQSLMGRGHGETDSGRMVRRAMTAAQFAAAVTLSAVAIVVLWQSQYSSQQDMGFRKSGVLVMRMPDGTTPQTWAQFHDALGATPGVMDVAYNDAVPGSDATGMVDLFNARDGSKKTLRVMGGNGRFLGVYGIPIIAGSLDAMSGDNPADKAVALDRKAATALGFANPQEALGYSFVNADGDKFHVIAVTERVSQEGTRNAAAPQVFVLAQKPLDVISVRTGDIATTRSAIESVWGRYLPNDVARVETVEGIIRELYKDDEHMGRLIAWGSLVSLLLAGFGVYTLAAYTVRRKTREIVLRKLYGAPRSAMVVLMLEEFRTLFLVGLVIGLPLAWVASQYYLGGFVARAPVAAWPYLVATLVVLVMAGLALLRHLWTALSMSPALALK